MLVSLEVGAADPHLDAKIFFEVEANSPVTGPIQTDNKRPHWIINIQFRPEKVLRRCLRFIGNYMLTLLNHIFSTPIEN
jgi:hypothetical protein